MIVCMFIFLPIIGWRPSITTKARSVKQAHNPLEVYNVYTVGCFLNFNTINYVLYAHDVLSAHPPLQRWFPALVLKFTPTVANHKSSRPQLIGYGHVYAEFQFQEFGICLLIKRVRSVMEWVRLLTEWVCLLTKRCVRVPNMCGRWPNATFADQTSTLRTER